MAERLFYVRGDVDVGDAAHLSDQLSEAIAFDDGDLVVDCAELTFIDFSGVSVLLEAQRTLHEQGRRMRIVNSGRMMERLLAVARMEEQLHTDYPWPPDAGPGRRTNGEK